MNLKIRKPSKVHSVKNVLLATLIVLKEKGEFVPVKELSGKISTSQYVIQKLKNEIGNFDPTLMDDVDQIFDYFLTSTKQAEFDCKVREILNIGVVNERMIGFV